MSDQPTEQYDPAPDDIELGSPDPLAEPDLPADATNVDDLEED